MSVRSLVRSLARIGLTAATEPQPLLTTEMFKLEVGPVAWRHSGLACGLASRQEPAKKTKKTGHARPRLKMGSTGQLALAPSSRSRLPRDLARAIGPLWESCGSLWTK